MSQGGLSGDGNLAWSRRAEACLRAGGACSRGGKPGPRDPAHAWARRRGWRKSYHRDNWLVAAKRPQRRRFL